MPATACSRSPELAREQRHGTSTARAALARDVPAIGADATIGQALALLAQRRFDCVELLCIVDAERRLLGALPLAALSGQPPERALAELPWADTAFASLDTDQEHVATVALHHGLPALPIVDAQHRLAGAVSAVSLLQIMREEHVEDLHRLAGLRHRRSAASRALREPPVQRVRDRLPWLLVGLAGSALATALMTRFEQALQHTVAVAFFVPGLVYLADAIGTQTEAIVVRGLSLTRTRFAQQWLKEALTGALMGLVLGVLAAAGALSAFGHLRLALAVGLAVWAAGAAAASIGCALPWALARYGVDPAYGSGPMATIIQDVLTIATYFGFVTWLVR